MLGSSYIPMIPFYRVGGGVLLSNYHSKFLMLEYDSWWRSRREQQAQAFLLLILPEVAKVSCGIMRKLHAILFVSFSFNCFNLNEA